MRAALVLILGPTASGKSALALAAAEHFGGTVINADSMQVYRDLEVITARPDATMLARAPHCLYGFLDAADPCSAERWADLAAGAVRSSLDAGRVPILTGGTGLYVRALLEGFSPMPDVPAEIRADLMADLRALGPQALHGRLAEVDGTAAARIPPGDSQRIVRALEVWRASGHPISWWQAQPSRPPRLDLPALTVVLAPPRAELYRRCDQRFLAMLESGALEEVERLAARQLDPDLPAMKALGVPELMAHLQGLLDLDAAARAACTATRRYAKRQSTWFRNQIVADLILDTQSSERMMAEIFPKMSEFLLTGR
ncbi:MAG: tRNA (adenosine(37)-N6)-dimethylallyltransferase MiaA [Pseudomonadota bacterium]|nr:tRNA (adenosine(37)-N6)-dimethylallyltransferase MiaA [Pseudomonadota bacterium]